MVAANICRDVMIKPGFVKAMVQKIEAFSVWTQTAALPTALPVQQCTEVVPTELMILQPIKGDLAASSVSLECSSKPVVMRCSDFVVPDGALRAIRIPAEPLMVLMAMYGLGAAVADVADVAQTIGVT